MAEDDKPPNKILVAILIGLFIPLPTLAPKASQIVVLEQRCPELNNEPIIEENALKMALEGLNDESRRIIWCESGFDPKVCNRQYGCIAGMGLWGFISGTWNETLDRMAEAKIELPDRCWKKVVSPISEQKTEAVFDAECNLLVGIWLYETDGDIHWRPYSGECYLE